MPQATQPWVGGIFYRAAAKAAMSVAARLAVVDTGGLMTGRPV